LLWSSRVRAALELASRRCHDAEIRRETAITGWIERMLIDHVSMTGEASVLFGERQHT
jgi:hypothetical protein